MSIFGHCPAHDEFYLVVCNHCSQVVKPQAFQKHCGEPGGAPGTAVSPPISVASPPEGRGKAAGAGRADAAQGWGAGTPGAG